MLGKVCIENDGYGVSWTQLYGVFNKRPGPTAREFINTLQMTNSAPIGSLVNPAVALVTQNQRRSLLIIQNNSTATSPDSAPTFYVGFGTSPVIGQDLALPPGVGIVLDVRVPSDAIYVGLGPYVNSGSTVVVQGVVKESQITNPDVDTANIAETGQLNELIQLLQKYLQG
jgi:hypothetical protein